MRPGIIGVLCCALAAGCAAPGTQTEGPPPAQPPGRLVTKAPLPGADAAYQTVPGLKLGR